MANTIFAFGVNEGSYMTEIVRAGILSVESGQMDAAKSLGMRLEKAWRQHEGEIKGVVLDMRGRSDVCDFFLIASGTSKIQVQALAKHLHKSLLGAGHRPKGLEGMDSGRWALLDFFDVVVHVFHTEARDYFQLEKLWGDAPRLDLDSAWYSLADTAHRHPDLKFTTTSGADTAD